MSEVVKAVEPPGEPLRSAAVRERIMTPKGAVIELIIVTVGVLIALSVDTVREWRANDALAAEARGNILSEIRENKRQLDQALVQLDANQKEYVAAHGAINNLLAGRPLGIEKLEFGTRLASISIAAYQTAEVTGAFGYMDYQEAREFAGLYDVQAKYLAMQDQALSNLAEVMGPIRLGTGPDDLSRAEMEEWKRSIERAFGLLEIQGQLGNLLSQAYARALESDE
jgi:hypothetical protein